MEGGIHVYCINLKHRADRWSRFSAQPELEVLKQSYEVERFEGINGSAINIQKDERISLRTKRNIKEHIRRDHEELDSAGGVGCYLSHTTVWKKFLERSEPYAIVLEDDVVLEEGFTASLQRAMKDTTLLSETPDVWFFVAPMDWYYEYKGKPFPPNVKNNNIGPWVTGVCATFTGYLISRRGAEKLLETAFPIDMHVDLYTCLNGELGRTMNVYHKNVNVESYALETFDSDIQVPLDKACEVCNVPTHYKKKGILIINMPIIVMGVLAVGGMMYLARYKRR
jgi:GR25 family glycosyltransferase involved in LPS biosynthesis